MGRKSAKGREKKLRHKEEQARVNISVGVVNAADQLEDPMSTLPVFKKFNRNGLELVIECKKVTSMERDAIDWAFNLCKSNMEALYEQSNWGWTEKTKQEEMEHEKAWYLIASDQDGNRKGFAQFRFDMDFDDEVLYCYEVQMMKDVRRKGVGKFLMQTLEMIAHKTHMRKVMLTVFQANKLGNQFFTKKLNYILDETTPSIFDPMNPEDYDYDILCKPIGKKEKAEAAERQKAEEEHQLVMKTALEALG